MSEPMGSDPFLGLPGLDRAEALAVAAEQSGRPASILEKDVWVVFCLAALFDSDLVAERTFWEKATAAHAFCLQGSFQGVRFSRHWYDLAMFEASGRAPKALLDRDLGRIVARHKQLFFAIRDESGAWIDYSEAVEGGMRLIPGGRPLLALADDYQRMLEAGLLEIDAPTFEEVIARCRALEERANG